MKSVTEGRAALTAYDFSFLYPQYKTDYPNYDRGVNLYASELRKFLELPLHFGGPLAAMNHGVDKLWHTFIIHTPQYAEFCDEVYGEFLHHQPRSERFPVPAEAISNFYIEYPQHFVRVPDVWFENIPRAHVAAVALGQVPEEVRRLRWSGWPGRK